MAPSRVSDLVTSLSALMAMGVPMIDQCNRLDIAVRDMDAAMTFYGALLAALGWQRVTASTHPAWRRSTMEIALTQGDGTEDGVSRPVILPVADRDGLDLCRRMVRQLGISVPRRVDDRLAFDDPDGVHLELRLCTGSACEGRA